MVGIFLFLGLSPVPFFFAFIFFAAMMNYKRTEKMSAKSFPLSGGKKRGGVWLGKKCVACEKNGKRDTGGKMVGKTGVGRGRLADGVTFFFGFPLYLATKETETETEEATNTNTYEKWAKTLSS